MAYTLEQFAADCHDALTRDPGPGGREVVRQCVSRACLDADFIETHFKPEDEAERRILYEDPQLGFCILAHVHRGESESRPHDHGPSWAIYGQATGTTEMTEWRLVSEAEEKLEQTRAYEMQPGDAYVYQEGDMHSPRRRGDTRLIRIEGRNLEGIPRKFYDMPR